MSVRLCGHLWGRRPGGRLRAPFASPAVRARARSGAVSAPPRARHARHPGRRPGVGMPVLASKITVPGVPGWAVHRPGVTGRPRRAECCHRAVRPRGCRAVAGSSRRGSTCPRFDCGRRNHCGRRVRTSGLPRASRDGGGFAQPVTPRSPAGQRATAEAGAVRSARSPCLFAAMVPAPVPPGTIAEAARTNCSNALGGDPG